MTLPLTMSGHDRTYRPPRSLRDVVGAEVTAWDLFRLEHDEQAGAWASSTLASVVAAADAESAGALGCTECLDTGFYGAASPDDPDLLLSLVRRIGDDDLQVLTATGDWEAWPEHRPLEVLDLDLAADLAAAVTAGASGLLRLYGQPRAFLSPSITKEPETLGSVISAHLAPIPQEIFGPPAQHPYALVHSIDQGAVLDLYRVAAGAPVERLDTTGWVPAGQDLPDGELPMVKLDQAQYADVLDQLAAAGLPKHQKCEYCTAAATQRIIHSEGMAYVPVCNTHLAKGKDAAAHCTPDGSVDLSNIDAIRPVTASVAALVADAPLTVSPDPRAEKLRRYWSSGKGAAKLRWLTPGDWKRCYRRLFKYMGTRAAGYCQNLHKRNTGVWTGSRLNVGGNGRGGLLSSSAPEVALLAALRSGRVSGDTEGKITMPDTLTDGVYTETDGQTDALLAAIAASAIPVAAPDEWFADPKLERPTTLTVTDEGRVYGHIAPWGVTHIGMAGSVTAPRNPTGHYAYFRTGQHVTASGKSVRVGQLTLSGGHAPMEANVASVVKHYDDTQSAVADVAVGEDQHGIWAAGALRPSVTAEQVRVMRACPPSGDWRRINGQLEMVAACHVNVQGFPIAAALYASGAVEALVAAGAREMAELQLTRRADEAVVARLDRLDQLVASLAVAEPAATDAAPVEPDPPAEAPEPPPPAADDDNPAAAETQEPESEFTPEELSRAAKIARTREEIAQTKREALRERARAATGSGPPTDAERKAKPTIKGTDSFPIGNVADLKKAIQAFGRAGDKPAAKRHIISQARKLRRPDLIPDGWKDSE